MLNTSISVQAGGKWGEAEMTIVLVYMTYLYLTSNEACHNSDKTKDQS